jgi:hypothetical protein
MSLLTQRQYYVASHIAGAACNQKPSHSAALRP